MVETNGEIDAKHRLVDDIHWVVTSDGIQGVRANPFLECRDNQRTRSCFLL